MDEAEFRSYARMHEQILDEQSKLLEGHSKRIQAARRAAEQEVRGRLSMVFSSEKLWKPGPAGRLLLNRPGNKRDIAQRVDRAQDVIDRAYRGFEGVIRRK